MNKIAVTVQIPALGEEMEFQFSPLMTIGTGAKLMMELVETQMNLSCADPKLRAQLISLDEGRLLQDELCFYEDGVHNGSRLLLF